MSGALIFCCDERRRNSVRRHATLNGIDFLEVDDNPLDPPENRQRRLFVRFLKSPAGLTEANLLIEGGEVVRKFTIAIESIAGNLLTVGLDQPGDYSTYTLRIVASPGTLDPPTDYDPLLSAVDFSFKVNCPTDADCDTVSICPPDPVQEPDISYLAKDFNSFRQLMLDRIGTLSPEWRESSVADLMHALIDLKAYVADYQSYQQDAIASEAYLGTARLRTSARRHARLVDYFMHDGCNARTWVQVLFQEGTPDGTAVPIPAGLQMFTSVPGIPLRVEDATPEYRKALEASPAVFEGMYAITARPEHAQISFYLWGDDRCCLPKGATKATLTGRLENLMEGDVLVFEEIAGPETGALADADLRHRQAVRLVEVRFGEDPLPDPVQAYTEIRWHPDDALTFPLCLSARVPDPESESGTRVAEISVARGNILLADHGLSLPAEPLTAQPRAELIYAQPSGSSCTGAPQETVPYRFRPRLAEGPVTQAVPFQPKLFGVEFATSLETQLNAGSLPSLIESGLRSRRIVLGPIEVEARTANDWVVRNRGLAYVLRHEGAEINVYDYGSAIAAIVTDPALAQPCIRLDESGVGDDWEPRRDLLNSSPSAREFVLEVEGDGSSTIRFGDDQYGRRPDFIPDASGQTPFQSRYRIGNGKAGNIGAGSLQHLVSTQGILVGVRNPLAALGAVEPETIEEVRANAPEAFRTLERAVTASDYATIALRYPEVQRAVADFRWTGSWYTVFLTVDRAGGAEIDDEFSIGLTQFMDRYRMAGYDLDVRPPKYVPVDLALSVCVKPGYSRAAVRTELNNVLSNRTLPDGRRGLFHPDNLTFGQPVFLSRILAAAMAVAGVDTVNVTAFNRQDSPAEQGTGSGKLTVAALEIARLDNDPNFPNRGRLTLDVKGGR